ncbi:MAG TPA: DUF507 family protein [Patescibacteria group bacterium]|jgi:hypothetical protein|nr:DUF507 family protein [Patescibacteria group bacterium]
MKLHSSLVEYISAEIVEGLAEEGLIRVGDMDSAIGAVTGAFVEDLMVEDRLNEEVREILRTHSDEMTRRGVQYHDMFRMIKNELARKRKLIL